MEKIKGNERSRCFACILYEDSESYSFKNVLDYVSNHFDKYCYIKHFPEEDEKKVHYHLVFYFPNKRWKSSLSNELNVPINYFQKVNLKPYLKYLIHYDNEEKKQYSVDEVIGPLKDMLVDILSFNKEENQFSEILLYIQSTFQKISWTDLTYFCLSNNFYSCYRRNVQTLRFLLDEHNRKVGNPNDYI